jgi:hypothetical protein
VVVRLGAPQALAKLPDKIPQQAKNGEGGHLEPEHRIRKQPRDYAKVLHRDVQLGRDGTVDGHKHEPDDHAPGNRQDVVLGPVVRHQRRLAQHRQEHGAVHGGTPNPFSGGDAVGLGAVVDKEERTADVENERVVDSVEDPRGEDVHTEEAVSLAERVELRVPVEQAGRNKLVQDTEDERREHSVEDIVEGQRP